MSTLKRQPKLPSKPRKKSAPRPYHHGDLRRSLLEQAATLLDQGGPEGLSLRDVARTAQVSPAAPYRHFVNKEALLVALAEDGFSVLEAHMTQAAALHPNDVVARLLSLAQRYLELAVERPHLFRLMFSIDLGPSRVDEGITRSCDRVFMGLCELLGAAQADRVVRSGVIEEQALFYWSTLHGYSMLVIDRKLDAFNLSLAQHVESLRSLVRTLIAGLA